MPPEILDLILQEFDILDSRWPMNPLYPEVLAEAKENLMACCSASKHLRSSAIRYLFRHVYLENHPFEIKGKDRSIGAFIRFLDWETAQSYVEFVFYNVHRDSVGITLSFQYAVNVTAIESEPLPCTLLPRNLSRDSLYNATNITILPFKPTSSPSAGTSSTRFSPVFRTCATSMPTPPSSPVSRALLHPQRHSVRLGPH